MEPSVQQSIGFASDRMLSTLTSYYIWKWLSQAMNTLAVGEKKANENVDILNLYSPFFRQIQISMYKTFVVDIMVFFDAGKYGSFSLNKLIDLINKGKTKLVDTELQRISKLKNAQGSNISFLKRLRDEDVAHQSFTPQIQKIIFKDVEELFSAVQQIFNILTKSHDGSLYLWDGIENEIERKMLWLVDNLRRGETARLKEIDQKYGSKKPKK